MDSDYNTRLGIWVVGSIGFQSGTAIWAQPKNATRPNPIWLDREKNVEPYSMFHFSKWEYFLSWWNFFLTGGGGHSVNDSSKSSQKQNKTYILSVQVTLSISITKSFGLINSNLKDLKRSSFKVYKSRLAFFIGFIFLSKTWTKPYYLHVET